LFGLLTLLCVLFTGVLPWFGYLVFLDRQVKRHGPEILKHIPAAVKVYRSAGALAWLEVVAAFLKGRKGQ
jgi:hypothetical protein